MKQENPLFNIGFNIIIPTLFLNKGGEWTSLAPFVVLLIALAFPFFYGLKDLISIKKINFISVLGLLNTGLTGGLALLETKGIFFAIKEATIPLVLGFFCIFSVLLKKPVMEWLLFSSSLFNKKRIEEQLALKQEQSNFQKLMNQSSLLFSSSFFLSAILNFWIAFSIFLVELDPALSPAEIADIRNHQIADMTWKGYVFIALPLMLITGLIMLWLYKKLHRLTGLSLEEMTSKSTPDTAKKSEK